MQKHFENPIVYEDKEISDFVNMTIKEAYTKVPKVQYPMITVEEILNTEDTRYSSNLGEEFSAMGFQINFYTRDISTMQSNEAARIVGNEINKVLGEEMKMIRQGTPVINPLPADTTILQYSTRYSCVFDIIRNIIYKD